MEDRSFTPEQAELLDDALAAAGVSHTVEFYPAHHGFAVPDNDTYDPAASTRHWAALQQLYQGRLCSRNGRRRLPRSQPPPRAPEASPSAGLTWER